MSLPAPEVPLFLNHDELGKIWPSVPRGTLGSWAKNGKTPPEYKGRPVPPHRYDLEKKRWFPLPPHEA